MATPSSRTVEVNFNEAVCVYKADSQTEVIVGYESRTFGDGEIRRRESLTRLKTTAYTYLLRTKPSGERVVLRDPASAWVLSKGVRRYCSRVLSPFFILIATGSLQWRRPIQWRHGPFYTARRARPRPSRTFLPSW